MLKSLIITAGLLVSGAAQAGKGPQSVNDIDIENMKCEYNDEFDFSWCHTKHGGSSETMFHLSYHQGEDITYLALPTSRNKHVKSTGSVSDIIWNSNNRNNIFEIAINVCFSNPDEKGAGVYKCLNTEQYGVKVQVSYEYVEKASVGLTALNIIAGGTRVVKTTELKFRPVIFWDGAPGKNKFFIDLINELEDNEGYSGKISYFATDYYKDVTRRNPDFGGEKWNHRTFEEFREIYESTK